MQAPINKELAALMQLDSAEQAIKTLLSSGVAPGTIAAQKVQQTAALTQAAPQAMPPSGIERVLPGVGVQAAMSAQAAQPATQGDVNQLRQMMAQAQQRQGVAQLPGSDVEMAEGGIVGYNGEGPSFVERLPEESGLRKMLEWIASGRPRLEKPLLSELTKRYEEPTTAPSPTPSRPRPMSEAEIARLQEANVAPSGAPIAPPAPRPPAPAPAAQRKPAETAKPADTGIAGLMGPPVPSGSERQFAEALAAQGRIEIPKERTPEQLAAERAAYYRSQGIDPNFMQARMERIAAQEKKDQEEAAARAALTKERRIENLISRLSRVQGPTLFSGLGAAQRGMEPIVAEQRASDERFRALMRERQREADRERAALEDTQRALADGDIARAEKSRDAALAARNARAAAEAEMRGRYAPQLLQAETAALDRASREREGALARATQLEAARIGVSKPTAQEFAYALFKADPEKYKAFLAAGQEPKSEGAMLKEIVGAVLKNPLMLSQYPPAIQTLVNQELLKLGVTSALPKGAGVRE